MGAGESRDGCCASSVDQPNEDNELRPKSFTQLLDSVSQGATLTDFFKSGYLNGEVFNGPRYQRCLEDEFQLAVLEHRSTGVKVWSEALDLRALDPSKPAQVLYQYVGHAGFSDFAAACVWGQGARTSFRVPQGVESLALKMQRFGAGLYLSSLEPEAMWGPNAVHGVKDTAMHLEGSTVPSPARTAAERVLLDRAALRSPRSGTGSPRSPLQNMDLTFCIPLLVPEGQAVPMDRKAVDPEVRSQLRGPEYELHVLRLSKVVRGKLESAAKASGYAQIGRRRVAFLEESKGLAHPDTLTAMHDLGMLLHAEGQDEEGEALVRRALHGCSASLGATHPDTLTCLNNSAVILRAMGKFEEAEKAFRQSLEGRKSRLGPRHPDTLNSVSNLAELLEDQRKLDEAEVLLRQVLAGREATLGPDHRDTLTSLNNLAALLHLVDRPEEAEPLFRRALEAKERLLGPSHPSTLTTCDNLGVMLQALGDFVEAEVLFRRSLNTRMAKLGPSDADTLGTMGKLGRLLQRLGRLDEAMPLLRSSLETRQKLGGADHPLALSAASDLGKLLQEKGDMAEAEELFRKALEGRERTLGPAHAKTLASLDDLAGLLRSQSDFAEANALLRRSYEACEAQLGQAHPATTRAMKCLGTGLQASGRDDELQLLVQKAIAICKMSPQPGLESLDHLADLLRCLGRAHDAEQLYKHEL